MITPIKKNKNEWNFRNRDSFKKSSFKIYILLIFYKIYFFIN